MPATRLATQLRSVPCSCQEGSTGLRVRAFQCIFNAFSSVFQASFKRLSSIFERFRAMSLRAQNATTASTSFRHFFPRAISVEAAQEEDDESSPFQPGDKAHPKMTLRFLNPML